MAPNTALSATSLQLEHVSQRNVTSGLVDSWHQVFVCEEVRVSLNAFFLQYLLVSLLSARIELGWSGLLGQRRSLVTDLLLQHGS